MSTEPRTAVITMPAWFHERPYLIQWERLLRWRDRADIAVESEEHPLDFLLALFTNILQMRDWLTASRTDLNYQVASLFHNSADLALARDIANGSKHMVLTRHSVDGAASVAREYDPRGIRYVVPRPGAGNLDSLPLADRCIAQIRDFMASHYLL
jgi:hypothetical protein